MRKIILAFVLGTLSLSPLFSQEAFYIYRNDSDFNGFFYDEVVEMRYSKFDYDSVEHEQYIMYEVQLADTLYRIPLAAIDSIGFQQPEIKFNPRVKFMEADGLCPYFTSFVNPNSDRQAYKFLNLPNDLIPQVGDVLLGLVTDSIAPTKYASVGGSFGCVVESVEQNAYGVTTVYGHHVTDITDVFEQYITVEKLTVDPEGKVRRRIAGCTPEGFPRPAPQVEGDANLQLIDFNSSLSFDIPIKDSTNVTLGVDMNFGMGVRVAYNISGWTKLYVKLTTELGTSVKPSFSMSAKADFNHTLSEFIPLPKGIPFPANCPIFELCPMPTLFVKASGSIEAKLNMPKVGLGIAQDIIIDTKRKFPISSSIYLKEPDDAEEDGDLIDLSGEINFDASLHTGIEFQMAINSASWLSSILEAGIGMHFYAGPKLSGHIGFKLSLTDDNDYSMYSMLSNGSLSISWLSLLFEAGARTKVMWDDPHETTFLSTSKDLFKETLRLAPKFEKTEAEWAGDYLNVELFPRSKETGLTQLTEQVIMFKDFEIAIREKKADAEDIATFGNWHAENIAPEDEFSILIPKKDLKMLYPQKYEIIPLLHGPNNYIVPATSAATLFEMPMTLEWEGDSTIHFPDYGGTQTIRFKTNCPTDRLYVKGNSWVSYQELTATKESFGNDSSWQYTVTMKAKPMLELFNHRGKQPGDGGCPYVAIRQGFLSDSPKFYFGVSQDDNNLENAQIACSGGFKMAPGDNAESYGITMDKKKMTITRTDSVTYEIERNDESSDGETYTTLILILRDTTMDDSASIAEAATQSRAHYRATGTLERIRMSSNMSEKTTLQFEQIDGYSIAPDLGDHISGKLSYGRYLRITSNSDGTNDTIQNIMPADSLGVFNATIYLKKPEDPSSN